MRRSARLAKSNPPSSGAGEISRRAFLKRSCFAAGSLAAAQVFTAYSAETRSAAIIVDPNDGIASAAPTRWAVAELQAAFKDIGMQSRLWPDLESSPPADICIVIAGGRKELAQQALHSLNLTLPNAPESLAMAEVTMSNRSVLLLCGGDVRGLVYATLELADRVRYSTAPLAALDQPKPLVEQPANVIRSIAKSFVSDVEDKPWYNDREGWRDYLTMLAHQRFNRFSLTLGIGYNTARGVTDSYFLFPYPFFLQVPGSEVRAAGVPDGERDRNLALLRFISDEAAARGLEFQLGLWTHSFDWPESPKVNHPIVGLTPANHASYCRDGLAALLAACPGITGLTLRVHGESGVPDGSFTFWETLFSAVEGCGRRVEIDMHAKGVPEKTIDLALATGMPVNLSPKFWAEHMGLPYHQAAIRELEMAPEGSVKEEDQGIGSGSRKFMRYGYGDLLTEDRRYGVLHRIWPGTRRALLWGDPAAAAGYGRASSFCGSLGVELFEPLAFKGRKGSGVAGGRCAYADESLAPLRDWEKFLHTYRLWGRLLYNPDTEPTVWQRNLQTEFGTTAGSVEKALARSSRILPLITTAHCPSANNMIYWPEIYTNQPVVDAARKHPYTDTPEPRRFGTVSPLDPQLFAGVDEFADALLAGTPSAKYSPLEVAQWLDDLSHDAAKDLADATDRPTYKTDKGLLRVAADVSIQNGIGKFFARKLRSAVLWRLHEQTGDPAAFDEALKAYRSARAAWAAMATGPGKLYAADITYGPSTQLSGHWADRLQAIDDDIADMQAQRKAAPDKTASTDPERVQQVLRQVLARPVRPSVHCSHVAPAGFEPGKPLEVALTCKRTTGFATRLCYRHVNQAERWRTLPMELSEVGRAAVVPAEYTRSRHALQYYFELHAGAAGSLMYPGFNSELSNQPYFVVRRLA
jgi:hypothetical protein